MGKRIILAGVVAIIIIVLWFTDKAKATSATTPDTPNNNFPDTPTDMTTSDSNNMPNGNTDITIGAQEGDFVSRLFGGPTLTADEIKQYAANAGFTGNDLNIAVAIALAESGGKVLAHNPETKAGAQYGSYGLWQIYIDAHMEYVNSDMSDPQTNANAAFAIYKAAGNSFRPWSTFNTYNSSGRLLSIGTGIYRDYLINS